jgi:tetratricopeptide (TPR) repeat protein
MRLAERSAQQSSDPYERAVATYNRALALSRTRTIAQTVAKFDAAISGFQDTAHRRERAYAQLERANFLLRMGSYREALADYRHAAGDLRATPWFFDCRLGQIICISQVRFVKTAAGIMPALNSLANDPERQAMFHHNFAVFCRQLGLLDCALTHLSAALESGTSDASSTAATLAEACLCRIMAGDHPGALLALARFESLEGSKDPQDLWTMAALSFFLRGASSPSPLLPESLRDDHEHRLGTALSLLLSFSHASSRASDKELVHQGSHH